MMKKSLLAVCIAYSLSSHAQVEVVESQPAERYSTSQQTSVFKAAPVGATSIGDTTPVNVTDNPANSQAEMFYQLQILQQEVLELRGIVEEQAFELKRLKQQRMDDYLDLDRRLGRLSGTPASTANSTPSAPRNTGTRAPAPVQGGALAANDEIQLYRSAIDLVLKEKNYDKAVSELNAYLTRYPRGRYAANAHYWLGEIFLLKNDLEQARQWFSRLLEGFADHRKAQDAKFKLGKVYHQLGDSAKAKALLQEVAASNSEASRLARNYLKDNL